jgi:sec-independent protein translocase protein TatB
MNSIFGIGVLEFIFILIFALIFLGPDRLPKVTREVLQFIRRLQKLSGDLTRQVNEEIGDLRELDPSYHMRQLMDDEEEEKPTARARQKKRDRLLAADIRPISAVGGGNHWRRIGGRRGKNDCA